MPTTGGDDALRGRLQAREHTLASELLWLRENLMTRIAGLDKAIDDRFLAVDKTNEMRFAAQEKAVTAALAAADRAVTKAEIASEKRFDSVNEFRGALEDKERSMVPRSEYELAVKGLSEKIDALVSRFAARESHGRGANDMWVILAAAMGIIVALAALFMSYFNARGGSL